MDIHTVALGVRDCALLKKQILQLEMDSEPGADKVVGEDWIDPVN